jgi:hypothetical protein
MQFVCAGLNKTGTTSLSRALTYLGFSVLHYDRERLNPVVHGTTPEPDFRVYDDVDAVLDVPAAFFFEELLAAYPQSKCILTLRDEDAWWQSIRKHFNERDVTDDPVSFTWRVRSITYGAPRATEFLYRKRYRQHLDRVRAVVDPERLLELDVTAPDAFVHLARFVGKTIDPSTPFPHANRADPLEERQSAATALAAATPAGARITLADGGWWWDGLELPDRDVVRVGEGPPHWGYFPDAASLCRLIAQSRREGIDYFAFAAPSFWWLDEHPELRHYLKEHAEEVHRDWQMAVYRLHSEGVTTS